MAAAVGAVPLTLRSFEVLHECEYELRKMLRLNGWYPHHQIYLVVPSMLFSLDTVCMQQAACVPAPTGLVPYMCVCVLRSAVACMLSAVLGVHTAILQHDRGSCCEQEK